jgi:hypothetical protein
MFFRGTVGALSRNAALGARSCSRGQYRPTEIGVKGISGPDRKRRTFRGQLGIGLLECQHQPYQESMVADPYFPRHPYWPSFHAPPQVPEICQVFCCIIFWQCCKIIV